MLSRNVLGNIFGSEDQFGEKCGVIGIWSEDKIATAYFLRKGLATLQHRGQESAGISVYTPEKKIKTFSGMGLVLNVLTDEVVRNIGESHVGIGHNRYSTTGGSNSCNAQPITLEKNGFQLSIGHNGNIPDCNELDEITEQTTDTYLVASLLLQERAKYSNWDDTLRNVLPRVKGAYCFVILTSDGTMYGARDPYGIRPFCLGKLPNGWVVASESVVPDLIGAEFLRDIAPGEIVKIDINGSLTSFFFGEPKRPQNCLFEYIYFSRPDSFENGIRIQEGREESGRLLAKRILKKRIEADAIVPVYDSGYTAAKGAASVLGLPIVDAITVSHYTGRTFIQPGNENRLAAVNGKHNIIPDKIKDKRIIVVDDSAVRLTTSKKLYRGLAEAGAKEVVMAYASPPVVNHCDLGIDMKSKKELPASQWENEPFDVIEKNIAKLIGADEVVYLPIDETAQAMGGVKENFYYYPFGGPHPIRGEQYVFPKMKRKIKLKPKIAVFASQGGSNLLEIAKRIESDDLEAEIVSVVVNKPDAKVIERAKERSLPVHVLNFDSKIKDPKTRKAYEEKLVKHIKETSTDLVVLAGWMLILGDTFLSAMQKMEIPVINLHPALLTQDLEDTVTTSRGKIPVVRGAHAIDEAFRQRLPVSGVTVHQLLPNNHFDIGPIVLKEEVRIRRNDTLEKFEARMHDAEYRTLPTAIKRVLHVIKEGIDVSQGGFYW